jgi:hypothetical protein
VRAPLELLTIREETREDIPALAQLHVQTFGDGSEFSGAYGFKDLRRLADRCPAE